ncbi:hypothetical protein ASZ90_001491 [hydrocarbon metagenome]|uniref:Uncharacterized protein n=1 Tax=hydrocarbon metagenome TaxID=938273 RepID=A0A0W8G686_9ZZZZ
MPKTHRSLQGLAEPAPQARDGRFGFTRVNHGRPATPRG